MKRNIPTYREMDPDAVIRSLHSAVMATHDFSRACARLTNRLRRLPKGSLHISHHHGGVYFYSDGTYLKKDSDLLYSLACKRYCKTLLRLLTLVSQRSEDVSPPNRACRNECDEAFRKLDQLIRDFAEGKLQLERILLTQPQYAWYTGRYNSKPFPNAPEARRLLIPYGCPVRSKSEQNIGNALWDFSVPCHYEESLQINVQNLVSELHTDLRQSNLLNGQLFHYPGSFCFWNVPEELSWMNAAGSLWRTYDSRSGCIRIHPDFTIMLADGSMIYWEHEGLQDHFVYRMNASERTSVMCFAGGILRERIIETYEEHANDRRALEQIIRTRILPYLWF